METAGIFRLRVKLSHPHTVLLTRNKQLSIWISFLIKQPLRSYWSFSGHRYVNFSSLQRISLAFFVLILMTRQCRLLSAVVYYFCGLPDHDRDTAAKTVKTKITVQLLVLRRCKKVYSKVFSGMYKSTTVFRINTDLLRLLVRQAQV